MKKWLLEKRWRIILTGTLIVALPILGLALFVYIEISSHLRDIIAEDNLHSALNVATHIEDTINDDIRNRGLFAKRPQFIDAVRLNDKGIMTRHLRAFVGYVPSVARAFVTNRQGVVLADYPEDRMVIGKNFSYRDWYQGVSRNWEPYVSDFYLRFAQPQKCLFAIALPIRGADNIVVGVLVLQTPENYIQEAIGHIVVPKSQKVYVVDKKGGLVYPPDYLADRIVDFTDFPAVSDVINGRSGVETLKNPDGASMLTAFHPVKQWGWGIIVQRPEQEVYAPLRRLTYGLFAFSAVMIAIGTFLAYRHSEALYFRKTELEKRVEERTDGLAKAIEALTSEMDVRRRVTEALRESEEKYRRLVDSSVVGIYKSTMGGRFIYVNKRLANMAEFDSPEEMMTEAVARRYKDPGDRERFVETLVKNGRVEEFELEFLTRTGKTKEVVLSAVMDGEAISGMLIDVTERKRAEKALRYHERLLSEVGRVAKIGGWEFDPATGKGSWTEEVARIHDLDPDDGTDIKRGLSFYHGEHRSRIEKAVREAGELRKSFDLELKMITAKGARKWVHTIGYPVVENGKVLHVRGSFQDITDRKHAEETVFKEKAFSEAMLDSIPGIFILFDHVGRILRWNRVFEALSGYSADEIAVMNLLDFFTGDDRALIDERIGKVFEAGIANAEAVFVSRDGQRTPFYFVGMRYVQDGVPCCICMAVDLTERKRLETQLIHGQKMESIGTLAGGIAHDFNNIMSAIIGYGHVVLMKMADDDPQRLNIEHMLEAADQAAYLTKQLLLFSRKQVSERKPVDLNGVVTKVEKILKRVIGEDVECKIMTQSPGMTVLADNHQLEQVLMNLATNARDAMPKGGSLFIQTEEFTMNEDFIGAHGYGNAGRYALITVSDTGSGMDEATRKLIFEPFFTTKEVGKGTGIGMAIVYGIIKQHDGFINVYSEPGRGTSIRIYLPIIASAAGEEVDVRLKEAPSRGTETILVAEDNEALRRLSAQVLKQFGYTVIEAVDGEDAVRKFMENRDSIDIFLSDLIMPKMNGKDACDEIRKINPAMKVIYASGYAPDVIRQKVSLEVGARLIFKPVSPFELLRKVRSTLDGTI